MLHCCVTLRNFAILCFPLQNMDHRYQFEVYIEQREAWPQYLGRLNEYLVNTGINENAVMVGLLLNGLGATPAALTALRREYGGNLRRQDFGELTSFLNEHFREKVWGLSSFTRFLQWLLAGLLEFAVDICKNILWYLRFLWPVASNLIAAGIIIAVAVLTLQQFGDFLQTVVCGLPFIGRLLPTSVCKPDTGVLPALPNAAELAKQHLNLMEKALDDQFALMDAGEKIPNALAKSKLAIRDLSVVIKHSDLKRAPQIAERLLQFSDKIQTLITKLHGLEASISNTVADLISGDDYVVRQLEQLQDINATPTNGLYPVAKVFGINNAYDGVLPMTLQAIQKVIDSSTDASSVVAELDALLHGIHDLAAAEQHLQTTGQRELLSGLWAMMGGNQVEKQLFADNLRLLEKFEVTRDLANGRIAALHNKLVEFHIGLEHFHDHVAHPLLVHSEQNVAYQINTIKGAITRLRGFRKTPKTRSVGTQTTNMLE